MTPNYILYYLPHLFIYLFLRQVKILLLVQVGNDDVSEQGGGSESRHIGKNLNTYSLKQRPCVKRYNGLKWK